MTRNGLDRDISPDDITTTDIGHGSGRVLRALAQSRLKPSKWQRLSGRPGNRAEALIGFRDAVSRYRVLTAHFEVARAILDAIELMPDEPDVRGWADEARDIFERLRAAPYLERLEAAVTPRAPDAGTRRDASARAVVTPEVTPEVVVPQST